MTYYHHIGLFPADMEPRDQVVSPRQLCLELLAAYASDRDPVPSRGLVDALEDFDVSLSAARAAITRLARRGLLRVERSGRNTSYAVVPEVLEGIAGMDRATREFGLAERAWDGTWALAVFNLGGPASAQAYKMRNTLRWLGFGPLRDGVWISPHAELSAGIPSLEESSADGELLLFRAQAEYGRVDLERAFPLRRIREDYEAFIERCRDLHYRLRAGEVSDHEALVQRTDLISVWRRFPVIDPDLPASLLPSSWPRRRAREMFETVDQALRAPATRRARRLLWREDADAEAAAPGAVALAR